MSSSSLNDDADEEDQKPAAATAGLTCLAMPSPTGTSPGRRGEQSTASSTAGTANSGAEDSYIYSDGDDSDEEEEEENNNAGLAVLVYTSKDEAVARQWQAKENANAAAHRRRLASPKAGELDRGVPTVTTTAKTTVREISVGGYRFWSTAQARQCMDESVQETCDLLCIPPEAAEAILRKYQWDGKRLQDDYFSGSTDKQDDIQAECGVLNRCRAAGDDNSKDSKRKTTSSSSYCAICMDDELVPGEMFGMACGHEFCKDCWSGFIADAVGLGPPCVRTQCPDAGCTELVTQQEVCQLAPPDVLATYQEYSLRSYIESNWLMRWCPGPSCDLVAVGSSADGLVGEGECPCGTRFCLHCGEIRHVPATCDMMVLWEKKHQDEGESVNWIIAKTKQCPKCEARIDKNGGCSHMRCSQCNHDFCWVCMQDWTVHGYNRSCNTFELEQAKETNSTRANAERELERYLHCFNRFQNHSQGQDFAKKELEKFDLTQEENEKKDSYFDWKALKDALGQLVECRRVLKYTYVVMYYLGDKPVQRALFEENQGLLESFTERLSGISEKDYKTIDRTELVNLTRIVDRYTKSVMDCKIDETL